MICPVEAVMEAAVTVLSVTHSHNYIISIHSHKTRRDAVHEPTFFRHVLICTYTKLSWTTNIFDPFF
jgi:hypothetical protein